MTYTSSYPLHHCHSPSHLLPQWHIQGTPDDSRWLGSMTFNSRVKWSRDLSPWHPRPCPVTLNHALYLYIRFYPYYRSLALFLVYPVKMNFWSTNIVVVVLFYLFLSNPIIISSKKIVILLELVILQKCCKTSFEMTSAFLHLSFPALFKMLMK